MRRWMKRIGIICLIPMVLVILISILLYIPPFQNFAVRLATEYASETTGMNIRIGQIRLSFPLNLTIRDVKVITPPDTLLSLESFQVNIRPLPLLKKEVLDRPARRESQYWQPDRGNGDQRYFRKALC